MVTIVDLLIARSSAQLSTTNIFPPGCLQANQSISPPPFQNGSLDVYVAHTNTPENIYSILQDYNSNSSHWEPTEPIFVDNRKVPEPEIPSIGGLQSGDILSRRPRSSSTSTTTTRDSYITAASYLDSEDESDGGASIWPVTPNTSLFGSPDSKTTLASSISSQSWTTAPTLTSLPDRYNLNYPLRKDIFFPAESPIFNMLLPAEQSLKYLKRALSLAQQSFFDFCKIHFPGLVEYRFQSLWGFQNSIGFPDGPSLIQWTKEKMGDYLNNPDGEKMNTTKPSGAIIKRLLDYPHLVSPGIWPSELHDALVQATDVRNAVCHPMAQELCNPENVDDLLRKALKAVALMDADSVRAMEVYGTRMSMKRYLEREWEFTKGFFGHMNENEAKEPPELEVHQRRCLDMMRRDLFEKAKRNYEGFSKWAAAALETKHIDKLRFIGV